MVDFDDLKNKAEALLDEHGDQIEDGIEKVAGLAGKKFGHEGQIDQAADKLKDFVDDRQAKPGPRKGPRPRPKQGAERGDKQRPRPGPR
jgi:hypothetical protein